MLIFQLGVVLYFIRLSSVQLIRRETFLPIIVP